MSSSKIIDINDLPEKRTVGQASLELSDKAKEKYDAVELQREMTKDYLNEIYKTAKSVNWEDPFYICVQARKERLLENVVRNQFYARKTRPLPDFDLTCFSYDPKTEDLKYEWTIPDPDTCLWLLANEDELPEDHQQLIYFIKQFSQGKLI